MGWFLPIRLCAKEEKTVGIVKQIIEDRELSFWDHLDVLRWMLFRVIGAWVVLAVGFFIIMPDFFDKIILAPCYNDFVLYDFLRYIGRVFNLHDDFFTQDNFEVHLQNINLASQFFVHITTSFLMAVVVTAPYLVYETWRFVRPALYPNEMKGVRKAFSLGTVFFFMGVAVGYFLIFPLALRFLSTYQLSAAIENEISLNSYIDNFMMLVLMMGVAFELPLVTWLLSLIGLVTRSFLREYRRHAFLLIVIFAAVITPTGDPFTLSAVSLPLYLLYELSIFMVKEDKTDEEEPEEEAAKEAEPGAAESKENKLVGQKHSDQKALPDKKAEETPSGEKAAAPEEKPLTDGEAAAATEYEPPYDNSFTPEATPEPPSAINPTPAPEVEYEEEYYIEDDMVKVRQVPKQVPAQTAQPSATAGEGAADVAPYEQLYARPEDRFVDGGDTFGSGETMPIDPYAPYQLPPEPAAPTPAPVVLSGAEYVQHIRVEAEASREAAQAAAKAAQEAAQAALEAAQQAAKAAEEAVKKAEEVARELTRRLEEAKPRIDVSRIRYDVERLMDNE